MLQPRHLSSYLGYNLRIRTTDQSGTHTVHTMIGIVDRTVYVEGGNTFDIKEVLPILKRIDEIAIGGKDSLQITKVIHQGHFGQLFEYLCSRHYDIHNLVPNKLALKKKKNKK